MAIKLTGTRSLQNKLERMAAELMDDASRLMREYPEQCATLAGELQSRSRELWQTAQTIKD